MSLRVFVIAGEASGDKLGAAAMAGLRTLTGVEFRGVGGTLMEEQGLESRFPMSELSLMGIAEILPKYLHLKRRIREVAEAILDWRPDVVLTIDSPDFCLRVADLVKARADIRFCHYVAPTVWAWRPERAARMAAKVDQVLALFPFEPPYFEAVGLRCDFVGHPAVTDEIADEAAVARFRADHGIGEAPLVLVLPGSRRGEIARLGPIFGDTLGRFAGPRPEARYVLPVAPGLDAAVRAEVAGWPVDPVLVPSADRAGKRAAFRAADLALAASGTVSLELAANGTPMVIAYRMNPLTERIVKRKLLVDTVTLVNLVTETRVVPEFLGADCIPHRIAAALAHELNAGAAQKAALDETMRRLGQGEEPPGVRAARAILDGLS
ncbi:lipid-A-disaccharide synthase [Celeribacter indicus]|uniref:Lipid-A-disaccharide synthase n=1 Tax=Celeribacter indicus TaxID=1208324 RepID=A0A0B5E1P1_9RHOB|nr:lipid-A-disaccharide synthase [Celeribacter indicus]AJE47325.1 lipid-A-disaccharide synthase [Celeribacter indicus]SDW03518.1 lipid-A-disaccharide synthase [Celeribacter indicus]